MNLILFSHSPNFYRTEVSTKLSTNSNNTPDGPSSMEMPVFKKYLCTSIHQKVCRATIFFLLIDCFLLLELMISPASMKPSTLKGPVVHEMSFANFSLDYKYILLPDLSLCDGSRNHTPLLVATVLSTIERSEMRQAIRETWASPKESRSVKKGRVLVYFILSAPTTVHDLYMLRKEQRKYNDLIVTNLPEAYDNLVFKVYASIVFHQQYCPKAKFLMKIDDDVAVHFDRMIDLWKIDNKADMSLYCRVWSKSLPQRKPGNKWFVPKQMWPERFFPQYCNGPMYIVGKAAGQVILDQAQIFIPMTIEDLFYTGILIDSTGVRRINWAKNIIHTTKRGRVVVFFILSIPNWDNPRQLKELVEEQYRYGDLIATDLTDSYENLVQKVHACMTFHMQFCSSVPFLLKVDDDVAVHPDRLVASWIWEPGSLRRLYCSVHYNTAPIRDPYNKWFVSKNVWPFKYYPPYCNGPFYVMGNETVKEIAETSLYFAPFVMEDVFYTGLVAGALKTDFVDWDRRIMHLLEVESSVSLK
ncbi:unnamed protein product [Haemonchus placei]|uniref:Hexosyltransferase n=1 Tax=Haemonchus placei TaxID=6290 RepID=A0A158QMV5_HAEPC|nr:unnamed protein product [Haemonchus placei]